MSEVIPSGPQVITFDGTWGVIPELHRQFREVNTAFRFDSAVSKGVVFQHDIDRPLAYLFVCGFTDPKGGSTIYDLEIDDSEEFARLYAISMLGRSVLTDEQEEEWHELQREFGMVIPHYEEREAARRLMQDFCLELTTKGKND
jgi:hypothetical protein